MKNLVIIIIAVIGVSGASFGQTEPTTKPNVDVKPQYLKTEKGAVKKKSAAAKKEVPAKKETPAKKIVN